MKKFNIEVSGMHCRSCELLIEEGVKKLSGTKKVRASLKEGRVQILGNDNLNLNQVKKVILDLGYSFTDDKSQIITKNVEEYKILITAALFLTAFYFFAKTLGLERLLTIKTGANASLLMVFFLGLTAGLSTCMALVGGLVLGISTRFSEKHPKATTIKKFQPHVFFNFGRIISYFVLGGVIGATGGILKLSSPALGIISIIVGFVMLFLGIQITEISPKISTLTLPKQLSKILKINQKKEKEYSHLNSIILGSLTFFLPCGFTQAMQVYAISTGSFTRGALIMGVFALGTTPGLIGIGGLVSALKKGYFSRLAFKFIGLLVILFSLYNISIGWNLSGLANSLNKFNSSKKSEQVAEMNLEGVQVLKANYSIFEVLTPETFKIKAGQKTRLEIYAKDDGSGCMGSVLIPGLYNEPQYFEKGKTVVIEFTAPKPGNYKITCAMGLEAGTIIAE